MPEFALGVPLGGAPYTNFARTCEVSCQLSMMMIFFGPLDLHLVV